MNETEASKTVPTAWSGQLQPRLGPGEIVLAWCAPDLDHDLQFSERLVVVTSSRVVAMASPPSSGRNSGGAESPAFQAWSLAEVAEVTAKDHAGLGTLELLAANRRLAYWRFSTERSAAIGRFIRRAGEALQGCHEVALLDKATETICPSCGAMIPGDNSECVACTPVIGPPPSASLWRLRRFARPRLGMIILGISLAMASTAAGLLSPYLTIPLLNNVLIPYESGAKVDGSLVKWYILAMAGAAFFSWLLGWGRTFTLAWVSERIAADMRNATYAHLQKLSLEFFGGKRTGDLMSRVGNDTDRINTFLSVNLLDFCNDLLMILMTTVILFWIDPVLALFTLCPFPLIAWMIQAVRARLRRGFDQGGRALARMMSVLADTIPGVRVVKAFAQEQREIARFRRANESILQVNDRINSTWSLFVPSVTLLTELGLLVVWASGAYRVLHGHVRVSVLVAFIAYISRFYTRLDSMSRMVAATQRAGAGAQRVFEILDRVPTVPEPTNPVHPQNVRGEIELKNVGFQYGNRPVVQGVELTIRPGEMIGLVGPSGAGKSTLVNLVCRFYDVGEGSIRVDGTDVRSFPVQEYRRHIGIVLQEPFLFYGTIAENIAYGRPDAKRSEIVAAARTARAHEFILRLPDGYDSLVGERGQSLSGGERQRISIARAVLIDPRILILDEATSSVDTETEREIQEALDNLIQGRTTIAIAHRLSTLRKADRLVVMERGRVVEVGHHIELLKTSGAYSRLHQAQSELAQQGAA